MKLHLMSSSTSYISDSSDYISSIITDNTPFPSLTKSQKLKLDQILHRGEFKSKTASGSVAVSTFTEDIKAIGRGSMSHEQPIEKPEVINTDENIDGKNSCCCLC